MTRVLDKCPECGYSLEGLPAAHACPECGLRYDEHSFRYVQRATRIGLFFLYGICGLFGSCSAWAAVSPWMPTDDRVMGSVFAFVFGTGLYLVARTAKRGVIVVDVLPDGIRLGEAGGKPKMLPWDLIERIDAGSAGNLQVVIRGRGIGSKVLMTRLFRKRDTDAFAARLRECMRRYKYAVREDHPAHDEADA